MRWAVQNLAAAKMRALQWFDRNFTFKGVLVFLVACAKVIPDALTRTHFWKANGGLIRRTLSAHSTISVIVTCALLIWLDHRRVLKTREPKSHDPNTLRGRTLKLRDELREFLNALGPKPEVPRTNDMDMKEHIAATWTVVAPWMDRLTYGYELRFSDAVRKLYLEFGERSLLPGIGLDLPEGLASSDDVNRILEGLDKLAAKVTD